MPLSAGQDAKRPLPVLSAKHQLQHGGRHEGEYVEVQSIEQGDCLYRERSIGRYHGLPSGLAEIREPSNFT